MRLRARSHLNRVQEGWTEAFKHASQRAKKTIRQYVVRCEQEYQECVAVYDAAWKIILAAKHAEQPEENAASSAQCGPKTENDASPAQCGPKTGASGRTFTKLTAARDKMKDELEQLINKKDGVANMPPPETRPPGMSQPPAISKKDFEAFAEEQKTATAALVAKTQAEASNKAVAAAKAEAAAAEQAAAAAKLAAEAKIAEEAARLQKEREALQSDHKRAREEIEDERKAANARLQQQRQELERQETTRTAAKHSADLAAAEAAMKKRFAEQEALHDDRAKMAKRVADAEQQAAVEKARAEARSKAAAETLDAVKAEAAAKAKAEVSEDAES